MSDPDTSQDDFEERRGDFERDRDDFEKRQGAERWVLPYFEDSSLWPVLLVSLAVLAAFTAAALLFAIRDGLPVAMMGLLLLLVGAVQTVRWERRVRGRMGAVTWAIALTWLVSGAVAWLGWRSNFL